MIIQGMTRYFFRSYTSRSMIVEFRILDRLVQDDLPRIANSRMKDQDQLFKYQEVKNDDSGVRDIVMLLTL